MFLIFLTKKKSYAFFQSLNSLVILKKVNSISHAFINSLVDLCSKYLIIILIEILLMLTQITLNRKYKTAELGNKMSFSMFLCANQSSLNRQNTFFWLSCWNPYNIQ